MSAKSYRRQQCTARSQRSGERCRGWAVPGKTVCYQHGGAPGIGRPVVHGRYSQAFQRSPALQALYEAMRDDPKLAETANEIAVLRALLHRYLDQYGESLHPEALRIVQDFAEGITRAVERRHKMEHGDQLTITVHDWQAFVAGALTVIREVYGGDDERYVRVAERLRTLLSTGLARP